MSLHGSKESFALHPQPSATGNKSKVMLRQGSFLDTVDSFKLEPINRRRSSQTTSSPSFIYLDTNTGGSPTPSRRPSHLVFPVRIGPSRSRHTPSQSMTSFEPSSISEFKRLRYMTNRDFHRRPSSHSRHLLGEKSGLYDKHCLFVSITGISLKLKLGQRRPVDPSSGSRHIWSVFSSRDRLQRHAPSSTLFSFQISEAALSGSHRQRSVTSDVASFISTEKVTEASDIPPSEKRKSLEEQANTLDDHFSSSVESLTQDGPRMSFMWREMGLSLQPLSATSTSLYEVLMSGEKKTSQGTVVETERTASLKKKKPRKSFTSDSSSSGQQDVLDIETPLKDKRPKTGDVKSKRKTLLQVPKQQKPHLIEDNTKNTEEDDNTTLLTEPSPHDVSHKQDRVLPTSENVRIVVSPEHKQLHEDTENEVHSHPSENTGEALKTLLAFSVDERQPSKQSRDKTFPSSSSTVNPYSVGLEPSARTKLPAALPKQVISVGKQSKGIEPSKASLEGSGTTISEEGVGETALPRLPPEKVPPILSKIRPQNIEQKTGSRQQSTKQHPTPLENMAPVPARQQTKTHVDEPHVGLRKRAIDHELVQPMTPSDYKSVAPSRTSSDYKTVPPSKAQSDYKSVPPSRIPSDYKSLPPSRTPSDYKSTALSRIPSDYISMRPKTPPGALGIKHKSSTDKSSGPDMSSPGKSLDLHSRTPSDYKSGLPPKISSEQNVRAFTKSAPTPGEVKILYTATREDDSDADWEAGFYDCLSPEETRSPPQPPPTTRPRRRFASRLAATLRQMLGWIFPGIVRKRVDEHEDQDFRSFEESSDGESGSSYFSPRNMSLEGIPFSRPIGTSLEGANNNSNSNAQPHTGMHYNCNLRQVKSELEELRAVNRNLQSQLAYMIPERQELNDKTDRLNTYGQIKPFICDFPSQMLKAEQHQSLAPPDKSQGESSTAKCNTEVYNASEILQYLESNESKSCTSTLSKRRSQLSTKGAMEEKKVHKRFQPLSTGIVREYVLKLRLKCGGVSNLNLCICLTFLCLSMTLFVRCYSSIPLIGSHISTLLLI